MGYGSSHEITLNNDGLVYAIYTGKSFKFDNSYIEEIFKSWDFTHPMDGMTNIRIDLLKVEIKSVILNSENRQDLKDWGFSKGDSISFSWYEKPKGSLWSGYTRSPLKKSFPVTLKGVIDNGYNTYEVEIIVTYSDLEDFGYFIDDALDFCPTENLKDEESGKEISFEEQYESNSDDYRMNYGA